MSMSMPIAERAKLAQRRFASAYIIDSTKNSNTCHIYNPYVQCSSTYNIQPPTRSYGNNSLGAFTFSKG